MKRVMLCALCLLSAALVADTLDLRSGESVCRVDVEHGARIVSWQVRGEEMLWNPPVPQKDDGTWRHGGIPVVWPWQCDEYPVGVTNGPLHGVAWFSPFKVESRKAVDGGEELALSLTACGLRADYEILIRDADLRFRLKTTNLSAVPKKFAVALHPYFRLAERNQTVVEGFDGLRYFDSREGFATNGVWKGAMPVSAWMDHGLYRGACPLSALVRDAGGARLAVRSDDAAAFWVWNPGERWPEIGAALYGELPSDAWRHILSIEPCTTGMKDAKPLGPGDSQTLTAVISRACSL